MSEWSPVRSEYRSILLIDVEAYSAQDRNDVVRSRLRAALRRLIAHVIDETGIELSQYAAQTTGDGLFVTIHPAVGKPRILIQAIDALSLGLCRHNRLAVAAERLRVRVVVHAADLLIDPDGPLGDQVNLAFRLLDSRELRMLLQRADGPMVLCVSDILYRQVIFQRHEGLDPSDFESIWLESKGIRELGWVRAPGESGLVARSGLLTPDQVTSNSKAALPAGRGSLPA